VRCIALYSLDKVGDQIGAALQHHIHLRPGRIHGFALDGHLVAPAYEGTTQHQCKNQNNNQNQDAYFHTLLNYLKFKNAPAWSVATVL